MTAPHLLEKLINAGRLLCGSAHSRRRQYQILQNLDDHALSDIGITRDDIRRGIATRKRCTPDGDDTLARCAKPARARIARSAGVPPPVTVRDTRVEDMPQVLAIYAHYVLRSLSTFEEIPPSLDELLQRRALILRLGLPYLVAELDGDIVGYTYATGYRPRAAYRHTIENSVYVAPGLTGHGVGSALLHALIRQCGAGPWQQMVAVIGNSGNAGSIALHRRMGFDQVGTLKSVGFKHGKWVDTVIMQRSLTDEPAPIASHANTA